MAAKTGADETGGEAGDAAPLGELTIRTQAMPADANPVGDIFGDWVMAQLDLAGGIRAAQRAHGRVATVAVNALAFKKPVKIGDVLAVHTRIVAVGRTSITVDVEAWVLRTTFSRHEKVTEAVFVLVALDETARPTPLPPEA